MPTPRFSRLDNTSVFFQAHVSEDSRYVIVPMMERAAQITGWLVYDSVAGELLTDSDDRPFIHQHQAREWVLDSFYREQATA